MTKLHFAGLGCAICLIALPVPHASAAETLNAATVNQAQVSPKSTARKAPSAILLRTQILLDRANFSPGVIDGKSGENARQAITAFQKARGLRAGGKLDKETFAKLTEAGSEPALIEYKIGEDDVKGPFVVNMPKDLEHMAELDHLGYGSPLDLLSEKFHVSEALLQALNSGQTFDAAGATIMVPNVRAARTTGKVAKIEVDKPARGVRAFGPGGELVAYYPASVGSKEKPAPSGTYGVRRAMFNPTYTYDPKFAFKGVRAKEKVGDRGGAEESGRLRVDRPHQGLLRHPRHSASRNNRQDRVARLRPPHQLGRDRTRSYGQQGDGGGVSGLGRAVWRGSASGSTTLRILA